MDILLGFQNRCIQRHKIYKISVVCANRINYGGNTKLLYKTNIFDKKIPVHTQYHLAIIPIQYREHSQTPLINFMLLITTYKK